MGIVFEIESQEQLCALMCDNWIPDIDQEGNQHGERNEEREAND